MEKTNRRIILLSGNPLCHNPRVVKEAEQLSAWGYKVEVLGSENNLQYRMRDSKIASDKKWKFTGLMAEKSNFEKSIFRATHFLAKQAHQLLALESRQQLGGISGELIKAANIRSADLYIAHSEAGMWAANQLSKNGKKVGVDMEDWFSEDLLPEARKHRPIKLLKQLERNLLCEGAYSSCTSEAMADALVKEYRCRRPVVIRNVFPLKDREGLDGRWKDRPGMAKWMEKNDPTAKRPDEAPVSIHWFSQTIGPGRGLEVLFQALDGMEGDWELHLRGNLKGYESWLQSVCPEVVRRKLIIHELVENEELLSRIAEHDIGYAAELKAIPSRNLTITNKFFQYLQAGLALVANDTAGQIEGTSEVKDAVLLFQMEQKMDLAQKLKKLFGNWDKLQQMRQSAWQAGTRLTWENESQRMQAALP